MQIATATSAVAVGGVAQALVQNAADAILLNMFAPSLGG
jgi:hypothetical protein